jgi:hypothetical protein
MNTFEIDSSVVNRTNQRSPKPKAARIQDDPVLGDRRMGWEWRVKTRKQKRPGDRPALALERKWTRRERRAENTTSHEKGKPGPVGARGLESRLGLTDLIKDMIDHHHGRPSNAKD